MPDFLTRFGWILSQSDTSPQQRLTQSGWLIGNTHASSFFVSIFMLPWLDLPPWMPCIYSTWICRPQTPKHFLPAPVCPTRLDLGTLITILWRLSGLWLLKSTRVQLSSCARYHPALPVVLSQNLPVESITGLMFRGMRNARAGSVKCV